MNKRTWVCLRRDFQVSPCYWSLQIPALENMPSLLGASTSGRGMFKLIDSYMYMDSILAEEIGKAIKGSLLELSKKVENGWRVSINPYLEASKRIETANLATLSDEELLSLLNKWEETHKELLLFHPPSYFLAEAATGALQHYLSAVVGERALSFTFKLLSGFPDEAKKYTVDSDIWRLAMEVKQDEKKLSVLLEDKKAAVTELSKQKGFTDFLEKHGHLGEVDPYFPKFADTPERILEMIASYESHLEDPYIASVKLKKIREETTKEIMTELKDSQRTEFTNLLDAVQSLYKLYEYEEHSLVRKGIASLRKLLLKMGENFASVGILDDAADIFFLEYEEINRFHEQNAKQLSATAAKRRRLFEENKGKPALPIVTEERFNEPVAELNNTVITGCGASQGIGSGTVKIIYGVDELWKVKKGMIVVTPMTFPEFSPIMSLVEGIITDEGGICCHAGTLAREIGIPAVVGTRNATKILRDGIKIRMDGLKGIVEIC